MNGTILLLGAGASVDAGMPTVAELTERLWQKMPTVKDINGRTRPEFAELVNKIACWDTSVRNNYEAFLEWIALLMKIEKYPYNNGVEVRLEDDLISIPAQLAFVIKAPIIEELHERHRVDTYNPSYLQHLRSFLPCQGRLDVFSLNYDLCVEDACRKVGIDVATGFARPDGQWDPSVFNSTSPGINLYKLHGSLNWGIWQQHIGARVQEIWPHDWREGEILLGPGSKLQYDDPYVTLYAEFHKAVRKARTCVIVGCRLADAHIREPIKDANRNGMAIVDISPSGSGIYFEHYTPIRKKCKEVFENGVLE